MKIDPNLLSANDLAGIEEWAREKRAHYEQILVKIQRARAKFTQKEFSLSPSELDERDDAEKLELVMRQAKQPLSNKDIRKQLKQITGTELDHRRVRDLLKEREGELYERTGGGRYTYWQVIEGK